MSINETIHLSINVPTWALATVGAILYIVVARVFFKILHKLFLGDEYDEDEAAGVITASFFWPIALPIAIGVTTVWLLALLITGGISPPIPERTQEEEEEEAEEEEATDLGDRGTGMICRDPYFCYPWVRDPRVATVARLGPDGDDRRFVAARLVPDDPTRCDLARLFADGDLFAADVQDRQEEEDEEDEEA